MAQLTVETRHGPARVHLSTAVDDRGALILGHGAGGGVGAPDLQAASQAAGDERLAVALVEQPYRVAGRRAPAAARRLDAAWLDVLTALGRHELEGLPLVLGGRSMGARVACRTAANAGAVAVLCLAFPLRPPARKGSSKASASRIDELEAVPVPTLVLQGSRDPFGIPPGAANRRVIEIAGDHSLRSDLTTVRAAVRAWLAALPGLHEPGDAGPELSDRLDPP